MTSSDIAISIRGLGKAYRLRHQADEQHSTLAENLLQKLRNPRSLFSGTTRETFWALKDVSFDIQRGEVAGIIGRNGAGKSTLLKILSQITEPTRGVVDLYGRVGSLLEVGTGFHPELTGRENIYLNGQILGMRRREINRHFDAIVDFAGVEKFLDTPVKRYSSGMYVRLAFAVAAHLESEILIIDEVLSVGDLEFQRKCLGKIGEIANSGSRTVLLVTHQLGSVLQSCNKVVYLSRGTVRAVSTDVAKVVSDYMNEGHGGTDTTWINRDNQYANSWVRFDQFGLCDEQGGDIAARLRGDSEAYVTVRGEILREDPALNIGFVVYAEDGTQLFWSFSTDTLHRPGEPLKKGPFTLSCALPRRFFNEGRYRICLMASLHYQMWLIEPSVDSPSIRLTIEGGLSDSPYWVARRPGLLAPDLTWRFTSH